MPTYYTPLVDNVPGTAALFNAVFAQLETGILAAPGQFAPLVSWTALGGTTASVTLSSISGSYKILLLRLLLRSTVGATTDTLVIQPNSNTTAANMYTRRVQFTTAAAMSVQTASGTGLDLGSVLCGSTAPANYFSPVDVWFFNYANTSYNKQFLYEAYTQSADAAASMNHSIGGGVWKSTSAISSIKFLPGTGSFATGSAYALYEMG